MTDRELLELAAKALGCDYWHHAETFSDWISHPACAPREWNPLTDDGDRYRLAKALGLTIDFNDGTVWRRLPDHSLIQKYWGGEYEDEAHAIVGAAAEIGRSK